MKNELFSSKAILTAGASGATVASPAFAAVDLEADLAMTAEDEALMVAEEGSCGEGTCGEADGGGDEGSCGEGTCGEGGGEEETSGEEGSCGEGTCGG
ncbi:hypothetical protein [Thioalkalivibrio sp.]|uniref:HvfA family oxazolone/thioamide-modified RiPP metallophore n=1 Tax=Thioalkalivibrio sp. TaxID=2093813 RepID=UPI00356319CA